MILRLIALITLSCGGLLAAEPPKSARTAVQDFFPKEAGEITILESAQAAGIWYLYVDQQDPESASQVIFSFENGKLKVVYGDEPLFLPEPSPKLTTALPRDVLRQFIRAWAERLFAKLGATKFQEETVSATGLTKEVISTLK